MARPSFGAVIREGIGCLPVLLSVDRPVLLVKRFFEVGVVRWMRERIIMVGRRVVRIGIDDAGVRSCRSMAAELGVTIIERVLTVVSTSTSTPT